MIRLTAELVAGRNVEGGPYYLPSVLVNLSGRLKDWREFWREVLVPRYLTLVQENFESEGRLASQTGRQAGRATIAGWPGLSPRYAAWKSRHFPGTKVLERTRRLRSSLAPDAISSDTLLEVGPTRMRIGTRVPWAKFHVWSRPFLPRIVLKDWQPLVKQWVVRQATQAGMRPSGS